MRALRGIGLVEVLAALAVLGVALLGAAALLAKSLAAVRASTHWQMAVILTDDVTGRLRGIARASAATRQAEIDDWRARVALLLPAASGTLTRFEDERIEQWLLEVQWLEPGGESQRHTAELVLPR